MSELSRDRQSHVRGAGRAPEGVTQLPSRTCAWPELSPPARGGEEGDRGLQSATHYPEFPFPTSPKDHKTKPQTPDEKHKIRSNPAVLHRAVAGDGPRKCLFSFQGCGMLLARGPGAGRSRQLPDGWPGGPDMTFIPGRVGDRGASLRRDGAGRSRVHAAPGRAAPGPTAIRFLPAVASGRCPGTLGTPM